VSDLVIGIDGGGTKTVAWLSEADAVAVDRPLGCGTAGPGNPRSAGFDAAFANIESAIASAFANANLPRQKVRVACLALAGADRAVERTRLAKWCDERGVAQQLVLTNDAEPLLAAASPENWGVVILAGTGSFAFGRSREGRTARCGGWGFLIGDEGSGYAIAIAGLRAAARAADGRAEGTHLLKHFQDRLQVSSPQGLIEAIYRPDLQRRQIADLADVVFTSARAGDRAAQQVVASAALELAELVRTVVDKLQLTPGHYPLAMAGGILVNYPEFRATLEYHLADTPAAPGSILLEPEPVRGAVVLARRALLA
jgi:N-acetylglucosamine kinase-like BadF-type ATPase